MLSIVLAEPAVQLSPMTAIATLNRQVILCQNLL